MIENIFRKIIDCSKISSRLELDCDEGISAAPIDIKKISSFMDGGSAEELYIAFSARGPNAGKLISALESAAVNACNCVGLCGDNYQIFGAAFSPPVPNNNAVGDLFEAVCKVKISFYRRATGC